MSEQPFVVVGDVQYGKTPEWVFTAVQRHDLCPQAGFLYGWLMLRYSHRQRGIFPSHKTLAEEMGVAVSTVRAWLDQLRSIGAIDWRPHLREDGGQTSNRYVMAWIGPREFGDWDTDEDPPCRSTGTPLPTDRRPPLPKDRQPPSPTDRRPRSRQSFEADQVRTTPSAPPADAVDAHADGALFAADTPQPPPSPVQELVGLYCETVTSSGGVTTTSHTKAIGRNIKIRLDEGIDPRRIRIAVIQAARRGSKTIDPWIAAPAGNLTADERRRAERERMYAVWDDNAARYDAAMQATGHDNVIDLMVEQERTRQQEMARQRAIGGAR